MPKTHITVLGKIVSKASRLRGGGTALPGLIVERLDPHFLERALAQLPKGVVLISGTNGKTTTTKMVVELLRAQGLSVFTNPSGSNFTRGIVASMLPQMSLSGTLQADIAVLELDEAHAQHFIRRVKPRYSLLLNVMRDQLDRFGEIDTTARYLENIAEATTDTVVLNREDPRIRAIAKKLHTKTLRYYGFAPALSKLFVNDDELYGSGEPVSAKLPAADVLLESVSEQKGRFTINGAAHNVHLQVRGAYNMFNAAAAVALTHAVLGDHLDTVTLLSSLARVQPAFGRGETIDYNGSPIELVLVKNPSGFRLSLSSFSPDTYATMIAINDQYADGRDVSWLWDVDFSSLKTTGVASVTGTRAYDMALRLQYDEVPCEHVMTDLRAAFNQFLSAHAEEPKRIFCTYTAMLAIRKQLSTRTKVEGIS